MAICLSVVATVVANFLRAANFLPSFDTAAFRQTPVADIFSTLGVPTKFTLLMKPSAGTKYAYVPSSGTVGLFSITILVANSTKLLTSTSPFVLDLYNFLATGS